MRASNSNWNDRKSLHAYIASPTVDSVLNLRRPTRQNSTVELLYRVGRRELAIRRSFCWRPTPAAARTAQCLRVFYDQPICRDGPPTPVNVASRLADTTRPSAGRLAEPRRRRRRRRRRGWSSRVVRRRRPPPPTRVRAGARDRRSARRR